MQGGTFQQDLVMQNVLICEYSYQQVAVIFHKPEKTIIVKGAEKALKCICTQRIFFSYLKGT